MGRLAALFEPLVAPFRDRIMPRLRALDRKLVRDLAGMAGQGVTIALVVGAGIGGFVALRTTFASLEDSRDTYYERYRFGDGFVQLERAPESLAGRLEGIPGVALAYTRVSEPVRVPMEGETRSMSGQIVSLPPGGEAPLNALLLREGRLPEAGRGDEALLLDVFAERWGVATGDTLRVVANGSLRALVISGLATSPEFIYPVPPAGALIPDDERFAVLWMDRAGAAPLFRMEGAFNDVVFRFHRGASEREILARVDDILEPYGGRGAYGRSLQPSHYFLEGELSQLEQFATVVPFIFLGVAAFLLNVVLSRLLHLQRTQVAALKALGYRDREIALHFMKMASGVVVGGSLLGLGVGAWLGQAMTEMYGGFFGFPVLEWRMGWGAPLAGFLVALLAAVAGTWTALRHILALSPAEAMSPEPPARYRPSLLERVGLGRIVGPSGRMVLREVGRRPLRTGLSALGIALSLGIIVVGRFSGDALEFLIDEQFYRAWKEDVTVSFQGPLPDRAVRELLALPGVEAAEGMRMSGVRMYREHRWRDVVLMGYPEEARLRTLMDGEARLYPLPQGGVVLTRKLGELLGVEAGDTVQARLREGRPGTVPLQVTGMVDEMFGLQGHMRLADLNALLGEGPRVTQALLVVDPVFQPELERRLADMPMVGDVASRAATVGSFREQSGDLLLIMTLILTIFASVIAAGVVYNNARVALSMRERDLASLRVLGFTRREVSAVLLGEMGVQVALAIPLGVWVGFRMAEGIAGSVDPERYRLPIVLGPGTYAYAIAVVLVAAAISALLVRRRLDHLDLIGVLKTRE